METKREKRCGRRELIIIPMELGRDETFHQLWPRRKFQLQTHIFVDILYPGKKNTSHRHTFFFNITLVGTKIKKIVIRFSFKPLRINLKYAHLLLIPA